MTATFPLAPLNLTCELNLGSLGWTDITAYNLQRDGTSPPVRITRGRSNEQATASPTQVNAQWNNRGGQFSPRNPAGPYYGLLVRNTPLRYSVPAALSYLRFADDDTSYASCPGSSSLKLAGDIDIRVDLALDNFATCFLAGQWAAGTATAWALTLNSNGTVSFTWYDGTNYNQATSTMPLPLGRVAIRAWFDPAGTSGTPQVIFYTAATMSGTFTQLGTATAITSGDYAHTAVIPLTLGYNATWYAAPAGATVGSGYQPGPQGSFYELRLYSGSTLVADPVFSAQTAGVTSFTDAQGNTWTLTGTASISSRCFRAHAECTTLPQRWDATGTDVWTPVQARGQLRRIQQGNSPLPSVMKRVFTGNAASWGLLAYWPCEDYQSSTQIASGISGGQPLTFSGTPAFQGQAGSQSADSMFACSAQLAQVQSSIWYGTIPQGPSGTEDIYLLVGVPSGGIAAAATLASFYTADGDVMSLAYATAASGTLTWSWNGGTAVTLATGVNGLPLMVQMHCVQPTTVDVWAVAAGASSTAGSLSETVPSSQMVFTRVIVNPAGAALGDTEVGHIAVANGGTAADLNVFGLPGSLSAAVGAYSGETAGNRFLRLCSENGINGRVYGYPYLTAVMGAQPIDTFANQLQYCEDADRGMIYEPAEALGLGYRTLGSLCAQTAGLLLNYAAGEIGDGSTLLEPTDDDQYTLNDVTCERSGGSSAQVQVTSGPMSINDPPDGVGDYSTQLSLYNAWDADLPRIASWIAWTGTCDEERYPVVPLSLARPQLASLTDAIQALRLGDYFQVEDMPAWMPPGTVDQLIYGYTESLGGFHWNLSLNAVPEDPYDVAVAGTAYADTPGSELAAAASSTATNLQVAPATTPAGEWTPYSANFPFGLQIAGEILTATAAGPPGNWLTCEDANFEGGIGDWAANSNCTVAPGTVAHGGSGSLEMTASAAGSMSAYCGLSSAAGAWIPCSPGDTVSCSAYFEAAATARTCSAGVQYFNASGGFLSTAIFASGSDSATGWTQVSGSGTAPASAAYARAYVSVTSAAANEVHYVDDVALGDAATLPATAQRFAVTRSVNGVVKAQAADAAVNVYPQAVAALAGNH